MRVRRLPPFTYLLFTYLSTHKIHTWIFVERVVSLRLALALDWAFTLLAHELEMLPVLAFGP